MYTVCKHAVTQSKATQQVKCISTGQWTEYNWNDRWGGKFEAICTQTFHATSHATKTIDIAYNRTGAGCMKLFESLFNHYFVVK